jgi:hypothetical protein
VLKNKNEYQTYLNDENKEEKAPIYKFVQKVCILDPPKLNDNFMVSKLFLSCSSTGTAYSLSAEPCD